MDNNVKNILTVSPHCLNAFKNNYSTLPESLGIEHYTEVLDLLIQKGRLIPTHKFNKTVTFHDPCSLGRIAKIYEEPRDILSDMPGIELVEMARNRADAVCCGTSGWVNCSGCSKQIQMDRLKEAEDTGADTLITACPKCSIHLNCAKYNSEIGIEIKDITDLIVEKMV